MLGPCPEGENKGRLSRTMGTQLFLQLPQYLHDRPLWRNDTVHTLGQVPDELRVPQEAVNETVAGLVEDKGNV